MGYAVISGYGIEGAVYGFLITQITVFITAGVFIVLKIGFKFPKFSNLRKYLAFSIPTVPGSISNWITDSSDRYIIVLFLGSTWVGLYSPAYNLGNLVLMLSYPFFIVLPVILSKYHDENQFKKVKFIFERALKFYLLLAIPAVFGLSILSRPLLTILANQEVAISSHMVTPLVALGGLLCGVYSILSIVLFLNGKNRITGSIMVIAAIFNLVLNLFLVPSVGIIGAAFATLLAYLFSFTLVLRYSKIYLHLRFDYRFLTISIVASVLMSLLIILINPQGFLEISLTIIFSVIIYILVLIGLKGLNRDEVKFFKGLIKFGRI